jgi:hypothetical protein
VQRRTEAVEQLQVRVDRINRALVFCELARFNKERLHTITTLLGTLAATHIQVIQVLVIQQYSNTAMQQRPMPVWHMAVWQYGSMAASRAHYPMPPHPMHPHPMFPLSPFPPFPLSLAFRWLSPARSTGARPWAV